MIFQVVVKKNILIKIIIIIKIKNNKNLDKDVFEVIRIKKEVLKLGIKTDYTTEIKICNFLHNFVLYLDKLELNERELKFLNFEKKDSIEDIMNKYQKGSIEKLLMIKLETLNRKVDRINNFDEIEKVIPLEYILNRRFYTIIINKKV
jgi:hypothetical protein